MEKEVTTRDLLDFMKEKMATKDDLEIVKNDLNSRIDKIDGRIDKIDIKLTKLISGLAEQSIT